MGEFLQELNDRISHINIHSKKLKTGNIADSDSQISEFISFRQEKSSSGDEIKYIGATESPEKLKELKQVQEKSALYHFLTTKVFKAKEKAPSIQSGPTKTIPSMCDTTGKLLETKLIPVRTFDLTSSDKIDRICDHFRAWLNKPIEETKNKPDPTPYYTSQIISTLCNAQSTADLTNRINKENIKKILTQLGKDPGQKNDLEIILILSKAALIEETLSPMFREACKVVSDIAFDMIANQNIPNNDSKLK